MKSRNPSHASAMSRRSARAMTSVVIVDHQIYGCSFDMIIITSYNATAKEFKLDVPTTEVNKMTDADVWPHRMATRPIIRAWRNGTVTQTQRQNKRQSDHLIVTSIQSTTHLSCWSILYNSKLVECRSFVMRPEMSHGPYTPLPSSLSADQRPSEQGDSLYHSVLIINEHSTSGDRVICCFSHGWHNWRGCDLCPLDLSATGHGPYDVSAVYDVVLQGVDNTT